SSSLSSRASSATDACPSRHVHTRAAAVLRWCSRCSASSSSTASPSRVTEKTSGDGRATNSPSTRDEPPSLTPSPSRAIGELAHQRDRLVEVADEQPVTGDRLDEARERRERAAPVVAEVERVLRQLHQRLAP